MFTNTCFEFYESYLVFLVESERRCCCVIVAFLMHILTIVLFYVLKSYCSGRLTLKREYL